jgi:hypothetical protein
MAAVVFVPEEMAEKDIVLPPSSCSQVLPEWQTLRVSSVAL